MKQEEICYVEGGEFVVFLYLLFGIVLGVLVFRFIFWIKFWKQFLQSKCWQGRSQVFIFCRFCRYNEQVSITVFMCLFLCFWLISGSFIKFTFIFVFVFMFRMEIFLLIFLGVKQRIERVSFIFCKRSIKQSDLFFLEGGCFWIGKRGFRD